MNELAWVSLGFGLLRLLLLLFFNCQFADIVLPKLKQRERNLLPNMTHYHLGNIKGID